MANLLTNLAHLFTGRRPTAPLPAVQDPTPPWEDAKPQRPPQRALQHRPCQPLQRQPGPRQIEPWQPAPRPVAATPKPDRIGLVGFHEHGFVIARPAEPFAPWLVERSQTLRQRLGGRTNIADGLRQALHLLEATPPGIYRKIWLLSDGEPNVEVESLGPLVAACHESRINLNTIGFGDAYDELLLRRLADATHRGKFVPVQGLRELTRTLAETDLPARPGPRRAETAVLVIDCSGSMAEPMEGRRKIAVVEEAILHLIHYKQRLFS